MAKRTPPDWDAIQAEYRTGCYSNRQIADKYGCTEGAVRSRAKRHEWVKDLSEQVRIATDEKLLRSEVRSDYAANDEQIVSDAAETRAAVVLRHRRTVARDTERLELLAAKFDTAVAAVVDMKDIDEAQGILESMARTRAKLIPIERQSFGIDSNQSPDASGSQATVFILPPNGRDLGT